MQRSSGDAPQPGSGPLANYDVPATPALAPGQVFAPNSVARAWPTLPELANALKRRLVLAIFLGLLVGTAAAAAVWLALPNGKHEVRATLDIAPRSNGLTAGMNDSQFASFKQKQQELIKTRLLLQKVIASPAVAKLPDIANSDDPVRYLEEGIRVSWPADELMRVRMVGDDPNQLQVILDALIVEFIKDSAGADNRERAAMQLQYENNRDELTKDIELKQKMLRRIVEQRGNTNAEMNAVLLKAQTDRLAESYKRRLDLESKLPAKKVGLDFLAAKLKTIDETPIDPVLVDQAVAADPRFADLAADVKASQDKLEVTERTARPGSPVIGRDRDALELARARFRERTAARRPEFEKLAREKLRRDLAARVAAQAEDIRDDENNVKAFAKAEDDAKEEMVRLGRNNLEADLVKKELDPSVERLNSIQQKLLDLGMQGQSQARITIREAAYIVINQNLKQKVLLSIAAFLGGTTAIMLAVAFLEWRSRRVDSVDQVVGELGLRVIGTIPAFPSKQALKSGDAATSQNWRFVLNESVNSARTMLLHTAKTQNMQVLMVTSAMQGEGKTSLASQLATSMATAGLRTLILDCDLRNPSMHKLFDAPLTPGCSEVLCQEVDVSDAVQPTAVPNLWLIPAGQCSNRVVSALAQGHPLETLFNRLRGQFDFVVVDSCPVLPVADTLLVGQHVDGVLISILQDISQLPKVQQVSDRLTDLNIPLLGAVVNGSNRTSTPTGTTT